jgi:hypothetical protein
MSSDYTKMNKANQRLVELSKKATDQNIVRIADLQSRLTAAETRVKELEAILFHAWVHDGYEAFGFKQMTTPQKLAILGLLKRWGYEEIIQQLSVLVKPSAELDKLKGTK